MADFLKPKRKVYLDKPEFHLEDPNDPVEYVLKPQPEDNRDIIRNIASQKAEDTVRPPKQEERPNKFPNLQQRISPVEAKEQINQRLEQKQQTPLRQQVSDKDFYRMNKGNASDELKSFLKEVESGQRDIDDIDPEYLDNMDEDDFGIYAALKNGHFPERE